MKPIRRYRLNEQNEGTSKFLETDPEFPDAVWLVVDDIYEYDIDKETLIAAVKMIETE